MGRFILWVILVALVLRAVSRLVRGILEGAGYRREMPSQSSVGLVRDPVCGVFVVPGRALSSASGTTTKYFCSEKCRSQWRQRAGGR
jgi:YHS domain-containing protein